MLLLYNKQFTQFTDYKKKLSIVNSFLINSIKIRKKISNSINKY